MGQTDMIDKNIEKNGNSVWKENKAEPRSTTRTLRFLFARKDRVYEQLQEKKKKKKKDRKTEKKKNKKKTERGKVAERERERKREINEQVEI